MKNFLFALFVTTIAQTTAHACPNFSGEYTLTGSPTEVIVTVTQNACDGIRFAYYYPENEGRSSQTYIADQQARVTWDDETQTVSQASAFTDSTFVNRVSFLKKETQESTTAISTYHLDEADGIVGVDQYYNSDGVNYSSAIRAFSKTE